jgi:hypothetical protein
VFALLNSVIDLTRESAARLQAGANDDGLALLERRDPLFEQAVKALVRVPVGEPSLETPLGIPTADLERLRTTATELGRLDAAIAAYLGRRRDGVAQGLSDLSILPTHPQSHTASNFRRRFDLRG